MEKKATIIIVEDNLKWLRRLIDIIKDDFEVEIEGFSNFSIAEDRLLRKPVDFDLVVTDIFPSESPSEDHRYTKGLKFADFLYGIKIHVIIVTGDKYSLTNSLTEHKVAYAFDKGKFDRMEFIDSVTKVLINLGFKSVRKIAKKNVKTMKTKIDKTESDGTFKKLIIKNPPYLG
jgi:DNA-binding NtrC family response regulator